jgi:hypothetical protein
MVYFQNKNPTLGKFGRALEWKGLVYLMPILNIIRLFGVFYGQFVNFLVILYTFSPFWYVVTRKIWQPCQRGIGHDQTLFF